MHLVRAFAGLRPAPAYAAEVAAPPYDVLSTEEARSRAAGKRFSFLHISRPEIDLPAGVDPHSPQAYAKAAENLRGMLAAGALRRDEQACYYAYRLIMGGHVQTGVAVAASVAHYDANRIRRHEHTHPDKEDDRARQIEALNAQTGPALLAYPPAPELDALLAGVSGRGPDCDVVADTGVRHTLWAIRDGELIGRITRAFDALPALYIADGHHRSAAASQVAAARRRGNPRHTGEEEYNYFLAVAFPHLQLQILPYNRVVADLHGMSREEFLSKAARAFSIAASGAAVEPAKPGEFGLYLPGAWYRLAIKPDYVPERDPVARLDVRLLADNLLAPVLGIADARLDKRVDFVGGIRGLAELEKLVDSGKMACAFSVFPTRMEDLMAVADSNRIMPPKSTWFEPKLADGLLSHVLD